MEKKYHYVIIILIATYSLNAIAANSKNPMIVEVQGTADVNVTNSSPIPVEVSNEISIKSLPAITVESITDVNLAPNQTMSTKEHLVNLNQVISIDTYLDNTGSGQDLENITVSKDMILRSILFRPSISDSDTGLIGCGIRLDFANNVTDSASNTRLITSATWRRNSFERIYFEMPYNLVLPQGTQLEATLSPIGGINYFCSGSMTLYATKM